MAPKRKRTNEPSLRDKLVGWNKELVRAFKTAKGFERQRLSKRIREGDAAKNERLEREVAVLKVCFHPFPSLRFCHLSL